jgi:hypothetical protein
MLPARVGMLVFNTSFRVTVLVFSTASDINPL